MWLYLKGEKVSDWQKPGTYWEIWSVPSGGVVELTWMNCYLSKILSSPEISSMSASNQWGQHVWEHRGVKWPVMSGDLQIVWCGSVSASMWERELGEKPKREQTPNPTHLVWCTVAQSSGILLQGHGSLWMVIGLAPHCSGHHTVMNTND